MDKMIVSDVVKTLEKRNFLTRKPHSGPESRRHVQRDFHQAIWLGLKLTKNKETVIVREVPAPQFFTLNETRLRELGITRRELEILELIANGLSNREIAEKLFVSENTVKTHSSRLFDKLSARRRTQAVQLGKEFGLIP